MKHEISKQETKLKSLNHEFQLVNLQMKEKDQEARLNELKIRELKRQLPAKVVRGLEEKGRKESAG